MHAITARWFVKPGCHDQALEALTRFAAHVRAHEPDTLLYLVYAARRDGSVPPPAEGEMVFLEVYRDEAAFAAHLASPAFKDLLRTHGGLFVQGFDGKPFMTSEHLEPLAGFVRQAEAIGSAAV